MSFSDIFETDDIDYAAISDQYASVVRDSLDCNRFATLVHRIGDTLNGQKHRFDKADILEQAFAEYSSGRFVWVDGVGRDHEDCISGQHIEFKFGGEALYSPTGKVVKASSFKLTNSQGTNEQSVLPNPADFYVFASNTAMALCHYEQLAPHVVYQGDGFQAKIPHGVLSFVYKPGEYSVLPRDTADYISLKRNAQMELIYST